MSLPENNQVGKRHCRVLISGYINFDANGGDVNAVSLPENNQVGKRHCRVLISGYINFDANGFDIKCDRC